MSASDLNDDILLQILDHLQILDLIRFSAVCRYWRSAFSSFVSARRTIKPQIPWLYMLLSSDTPESSCFYSITERRFFPINLPRMAGHHIVGSSDGFLVSTDDISADLHITNPLTGACVGPLPPTSTLPTVISVVGNISEHGAKYIVREVLFGPIWEISIDDMRRQCYEKAIVSPSSDVDADVVVVAIYGQFQRLTFARPGDRSWTALDSRIALDSNIIYTCDRFTDMVFHKGKLCAVDWYGTFSMFGLGQPSGDSLVVLIDSPLRFSHRSEFKTLMIHLVESSDGEDLFMVYRVRRTGVWRTLTFRVFKLEESEHRWNEVISLGELALFLGFSQSVSLLSNDEKNRINRIYHTEDSNTKSGDMGVFDLGNGQIEPFNFSKELQQHTTERPMWFSPVLYTSD